MLANFYIGQEMRWAKAGRRWIIQNDNQLEHEIQSGLFIVVERRYERGENVFDHINATIFPHKRPQANQRIHLLFSRVTSIVHYYIKYAARFTF